MYRIDSDYSDIYLIRYLSPKLEYCTKCFSISLSKHEEYAAQLLTIAL